MVKKLLSTVLAVTLVNLLTYTTVSAVPSDSKEIQFAARVKENILKLGVGPDAVVQVKLRDKRKLKGYVAEANDQTFVVVDSTTGMETTIAYPQVKNVKGHNLSSGVKIAIGIGIAIGVLALLAYIFKDHIVAY